MGRQCTPTNPIVLKKRVTVTRFILKYPLSSTIHHLTDWLPTQTPPNPHEHWHPPKSVRNIYLFILFIYIWMGIYICVFIFFCLKPRLLWLWFVHWEKKITTTDTSPLQRVFMRASACPNWKPLGQMMDTLW